MRINKALLPIKMHYFFFMAAMGPILPQLPVYGKELGISPVIMGTINGILPLAFLFAKPIFGLLVDIYRNYRKTIFMSLIFIMTLSYAAMNFIPARTMIQLRYPPTMDYSGLEGCNSSIVEKELECNDVVTRVVCEAKCARNEPPVALLAIKSANSTDFHLCRMNNASLTIPGCDIVCSEDIETDNGCLYKTFTFWSFVVLMSVGTIGFNVINSISDAICFDVIGEKYDYGKQRVWGTIGFGLTALLSGYVVNFFSKDVVISYTPMFLFVLVCAIVDLVACLKLKLPVIPSPENIFQDMKHLLNNRYVITFITFAVFAGILDSLIIYFLFWYLEDLAIQTNTANIKLIEGLIVAAETLGGEVVFFSISGKILERFGHVYTFSMCFIFYALRLALISVVPSPWWVIPIELFLQGPTYALTYSTIVAYAAELAPAGASATMQGLAAGMDDGVGYALGSVLSGWLYRLVGGRHTLHVFSAFGVFCSVLHLVLHRTALGGGAPAKADYRPPGAAAPV